MPVSENSSADAQVADWSADVSSDRHIAELMARLPAGFPDIQVDRKLGEILDSLQMLELGGILAGMGLHGDHRRMANLSLAELRETRSGEQGRASLDRGESEARSSLHPPLRTKNFRLRPIGPEHLNFVYQLAVDEEVGFRWRLRGSMPTMEAFQKMLWQGTLVQLVAVSVDSAEPLGHMVCYNYDAGHQIAYVGAIFAPPLIGTGLPVEAIDCFLRYLFTTWNLRKLYFEVPEFNYSQFASGLGSHFIEEGRLCQHEYYAGRYWDRIYLAVYRAVFLDA